MEEILIYNASKDFNSSYNIKLIGVLPGSGTVTLEALTKEGGTVVGTIGTLSAGDCKALDMGKATLRVTVAGGAQYSIG